MRSPSHLHSSTSLLLVTVALLLGGVGVVQAQQAPPITRAQQERLDEVRSIMEATPPTAPAPTTTTTTAPPPPPTTTPVPVTVPVTAPRPVPKPTTTTTTAPAPPVDSKAYAMDLVRRVVPAAWLAQVPVRIEVIGGKTSWSSWGGLIQIDDWHLLRSTVAHAENTLAHEWGHQAAWRYGTDVYNGAPPAGFPYSGPSPQEQWADCVAEVLTGSSYPSAGLGRCPSAAVSFASSWIAAGPGTPLR